MEMNNSLVLKKTESSAWHSSGKCQQCPTVFRDPNHMEINTFWILFGGET